MTALYIQVLSLGLLWTSIHCGGMCGPIMIGLNARAKSRGEAAARVLVYQLGRAITYILLGAVAGLTGQALREALDAASFVPLLMGALFLLAALFSIPALASRLPRPTSWPGQRLTSRAAKMLFRSRGALRLLPVGMLMGFLPCMLTFWVLGVAASSASAFHGAMLMLLLIVMTTPVLLLAGCASTLLKKFRPISSVIVPLGLAFSGVWLLLIGAAASGVIAHQHLTFKLFGNPYMLMLW